MAIRIHQNEFAIGWLVVLGSFVSHFIVLGVGQTFGILFSDLLDYFGSGKGETTWIISLNTGITFGAGPIAGIVTRKFGCHVATLIGSILATVGMALCFFVPDIHVLYITYGIIAGFGFSFLHHVQHTVVQYYFYKRRSLATAIASTGSGIGTIILPLLLRSSLDYYHWRGTFFIMAGVCLEAVLCAVLYWVASNRMSYVANSGTEPEKIHQKNALVGDMMSVLKNGHFVFFVLSASVIATVIYIPFIVLPDFTEGHGISKTQSALLITISGISGIIGRLVLGLLLDSFPRQHLLLHGLNLIVGGLFTIFLAFMNSFPLFGIYAVILGVLAGGVATSIPVLCVDLVGRDLLSVAFGMKTLFQCSFLIFGPPIGGWIADITGNYSGTLFFSGSAFILAGIMAIGIQISVKTSRGYELSDKQIEKTQHGIFTLKSSYNDS